MPKQRNESSAANTTYGAGLRAGYARRRNVLGDVCRIDGRRVSGITHAGRPFAWKRGPDVELIEFGSFNPDNDTFEEGGRVIGH